MTSENKRRKGKNSYCWALWLKTKALSKIKTLLFYKRKDRVELNKLTKEDDI